MDEDLRILEVCKGLLIGDGYTTWLTAELAGGVLPSIGPRPRLRHSLRLCRTARRNRSSETSPRNLHRKCDSRTVHRF
jgi:hypothetical protein